MNKISWLIPSKDKFYAEFEFQITSRLMGIVYMVKPGHAVISLA